MKKETIRETGLWTFRIMLLLGALYCGIHNKNDIAGYLVVALVGSFFLLD